MSLSLLQPRVDPKARESVLSRVRGGLSKALSKAWSSTDVEDRLFFLGLALLGIGVYRLRPDAAAIVVGLLLILAVRPLRRWF